MVGDVVRCKDSISNATAIIERFGVSCGVYRLDKPLAGVHWHSDDTIEKA